MNIDRLMRRLIGPLIFATIAAGILAAGFYPIV